MQECMYDRQITGMIIWLEQEFQPKRLLTILQQKSRAVIGT